MYVAYLCSQLVPFELSSLTVAYGRLAVIEIPLPIHHRFLLSANGSRYQSPSSAVQPLSRALIVDVCDPQMYEILVPSAGVFSMPLC